MNAKLVLLAAALATSFVSTAHAAAADAAPASTSSIPILGATGIGVKDLESSTRFYTAVLGMKVLRRFELGYLNEVVMGFGESGGANVVLMNWPNDATRHYDGSNVKLVFYVHDPAQVIELIRNNGGKIDREAAPIEALNGTVVGLGRDPDNYVIELLAR